MRIALFDKYTCYFNILFGILILMFYCTALTAQNSSPSFSKGYKADLPESIDLVSEKTSFLIDSIVNDGILQKAFPGAQLMVASKGEIIYHKAFGYHTYDSLKVVALNAIYDLASVTKIIGPLPALMKLHDEGKLDLDVPFSNYWPSWKKSKDKRNLSLREILAHQAGLEPYIVFLNYVLKDKELRPKYIDNTASRSYNARAYDSLFVKDRFRKKVYREINKSTVSQEKKYLYSGLAFLLFPEVIENLSGSSYPYYLYKNFYLPLGAATLGFKPKERNFTNDIIPTEKDSVFRETLVQSWVHDENAALLGGISGNAGLFGSASDLFKIMQMYQNYGVYNYKRYISNATMKEFTKVQYSDNNNRRGLGFDKPYLDNHKLPIDEAYPAPSASVSSFGHSGFTGTFVWADPENQLVFIFLSNRVYPTRANRNLYSLNIRTKLHQLFYEELNTPK